VGGFGRPFFLIAGFCGGRFPIKLTPCELDSVPWKNRGGFTKRSYEGKFWTVAWVPLPLVFPPVQEVGRSPVNTSDLVPPDGSNFLLFVGHRFPRLFQE